MNKRQSRWSRLHAALGLGLILLPPMAFAQEDLNWAASKYFKYNIQSALAGTDATGARIVKVTFSVTNPQNNTAWNIQTAPEFLQPAGVSRLFLDVGWTTTDYQNDGSRKGSLAPVPFVTVNGVPSGGGSGVAPALPILVDAVKNAVPVGPANPGAYTLTVVLPPQASRTGVATIEGHPAWPEKLADGSTVWKRVPVKSAYRYFAITDLQPVARREVVDINKCKQCHDGGQHGDVVVPRLTLHGGNRTEEIRVCVVCHNANQTDIAYRTSGDEVSVDFKRMVHAIHAADKRETPFVVVGFRGAVTDFSHVDFPGEVNDCLKCHIEINGKGTFELPLRAGVLGSTIVSGSVPGGYVDVDPANDLRISPTAAVCSSCHDKDEDIVHMASARSGGAFFTTQAKIDSGLVVERCVNCHGPGKERDVRKVHGED